MKHKRYLLAGVAAAVAMFGLSYYLMVFNINGKSIIAYAYMNGARYTIISIMLTALISILFGMYVSVWLLRRDIKVLRKISARAIMWQSGAVGGILAAGCPTCGAPLLALFGAPLALMFLPFKGLELKMVSLILLFLSIYWLAENVHQQLSRACKINTPTSG